MEFNIFGDTNRTVLAEEQNRIFFQLSASLKTRTNTEVTTSYGLVIAGLPRIHV